MTVIDSLFVEIGLDPTKYKKGQKEIVDTDAKTREQLLKTGKQIEEQGKKSGESIGALHTNVLGLFAAFTGVGVTAFMTSLVKTDAQVGYTALTLGKSVPEISKWQVATKLMGGTAEDATTGISSLNTSLQMARLTGDASFGAFWKQLAGIDVVGFNNKFKTFEELFLELADKMHKLPPEEASVIAAKLGIPPGMVPLLLQGSEAIKGYLKQAAALVNANNQSAESAQRFEGAQTSAWEKLKSVGRMFYPAGSWLLEHFSSNQDFKSKSLEEQSQILKNRAAGLNDDGSQKHAPGVEALAAKFKTQGLAGGAANVPMTDKERQELALIRKDESAGKNAMNYIGGPGHTAQGYYQITNTNWRRLAPGLGITAPNAMSASDEDQTRVALALRRESGMGNWANFNPKLRADMNLLTGAAMSASSTDNSRSSSSHSEVHIGQINVYPPNGDADSIAKGIGPAIKRDMFTQQANDGPQ